MKKINYISEINLPSTSGYTHHVLKICDAFSNFEKTKLFVLSNNTNFKELKSKYLLKKKFQNSKIFLQKKLIFLIGSFMHTT